MGPERVIEGKFTIGVLWVFGVRESSFVVSHADAERKVELFLSLAEGTHPHSYFNAHSEEI